MKKIFLSAFLMLAVASGIFAVANAMTYDEASTKGKPVVVMFHQHGCSACRKFAPTFDKFAAKFSDKFNFVKEDVNGSKIGKTLNFATVPAIFIIQPKTMAAKRIDDNCAWDDGCFSKALRDY